ncbi:hypothetical protein BJV74DRAFT_866330 [Russula compacta]|nr:hypothetical protein BJV74DRAFT_866330 [Russula compacta]
MIHDFVLWILLVLPPPFFWADVMVSYIQFIEVNVVLFLSADISTITIARLSFGNRKRRVENVVCQRELTMASCSVVSGKAWP